MHCIFDGAPVLHVPSFCDDKYLLNKTCWTADIFRIQPRHWHKHKIFHIVTFIISAMQLFGFQWHIKSIEYFVWLEAENRCSPFSIRPHLLVRWCHCFPFCISGALNMIFVKNWLIALYLPVKSFSVKYQMWEMLSARSLNALT